jgi:hypothetical protein
MPTEGTKKETTFGTNRIRVNGSFLPKGTGTPAVFAGKGFTISRTAVGNYLITLDRVYTKLVSAICSVRTAAKTPTTVQFGDYNASAGTLQIDTYEEAAGTFAEADLADDADNVVNFELVFARGGSDF